MAGSSGVRLSKTNVPGDVQEMSTNELLVGAVVENIETTWHGASLEGLTLKLKDGRTAVLRVESGMGYENTPWGSIEIEIDGKEYP